MKKTVCYTIFIFFVIFFLGCSKTSIKGKILFAPNNEALEDVNIIAIPNLQTEERGSLSKEGKTDKNGDFIITGLKKEYNYGLYINDRKYQSVLEKMNIFITPIEGQTFINSRPIMVIDILPGNKGYIKRKDGKIEELRDYGGFHETKIEYSLADEWGYRIPYRFATLDPKDNNNTVTEPYIYYATEDELRNSNATKVSNGEILYYNTSSNNGLGIGDWSIFPLKKYTVEESYSELVKTFNLPNGYFVGGLYFAYKKTWNSASLGFQKEGQKFSVYSHKYYFVNLPKGFYVLSSLDYTNNYRLDSRVMVNYIIEVIDGAGESEDLNTELKNQNKTSEITNSDKKTMDLNGIYFGTIKDKTKWELEITNFDGKNFKGHNISYWKNYTNGLKANITGTYNAATGDVVMYEEKTSKGSGIFKGKLSNQGFTLSGKWQNYNGGETMNWEATRDEEDVGE